ncbi:MAG: hypothetical protein ACTHMK_04290 [Dyella sp.]|uniref:hypothetical protein n=1 Tax=Dyella sp. TaxID=1869338 RepID=UPI003F7FBB3A
MKFPFSLTAVSLVLMMGGCATANQPAASKVFSGTYFYNFESSSFTPDGTDETWCLSGSMQEAELPARGASGPWGTAHVVVLGALSGPGHYCNLGASRYILTVSQVIKVSDKRAQEP